MVKKLKLNLFFPVSTDQWLTKFKSKLAQNS